MQSDFLELERDDDLAIVWLDQQDRSVNTLSSEALAALDDALDAIEQDANVQAVVFISRKENSFVVGADVKELQDMERPDEVEALSRQAHRLLARMQRLSKPTVAAMHGPAMGGGLEMALSATYRLATDHARTKFALPEVKLGLLPGGGGTQHLPRLIGLQQALPIMLTGKNVYPRKARRIGLVDALTHRHGLLRAAKQAARDLADGHLEPARAAQGLGERLLESNTLSRRLIYKRARAQTREETKGNYPAPPKIIDCVKAGLEDSLDAGLDAEARAFGELAFTPEARQLMFLFFAKQDAEKNPWSEQAQPVKQLGVLGGGLMGAGIAQVSAANGLDVTVKDQTLELAAGAKQTVWSNLSRQVKKGALSDFERDVISERIVPAADYAPLHDADLVIEAVPEDLELKQQVLADTEAVTPDDSIFASNTSSIPIRRIAEQAERPDQVVGMHYFSPVPNIPLLEIIRTDDTPDEVLATACAVGRRQGKTIIVVRDGPGFYTTRILALYMNEALLLLEDGADIEQVDRVMEQFGFPMGPYALFDLVGIDTAAKIAEVMSDSFSERDLAISFAADRLAEQNLLGQKTQRGFYTHSTSGSGRPERQDLNEEIYAFFGGSDRTKMNPELIQQRLALVMINESVRCLEEGVLSSPQDGDVGAVFGLGFPPFRGGPFRYADAQDAAAVVMRLERLQNAYGARFAPANRLRQHAQNEATFYDESGSRKEKQKPL